MSQRKAAPKVMPSVLRGFFLVQMAVALMFGFFPLFFPEVTAFKFERLHVFLFNLCTGGTIILIFTQNTGTFSKRSFSFLVIAILFAFLAFFNMYAPAVACAFVLSAIVESIRQEAFSFFPSDFFNPRTPVRHKFHQASLLCLSIGLAMSGLVILNNVFFHWITHMPKLTLDTFFLGFSFPSSLITMSVMFSLILEDRKRTTRILKEIGFWAVNLGVIIFFIFILFQWMTLQLIISLTLCAAVVMIFFLYRRDGSPVQQKNFLTSGMGFLLFTAVTGILYIMLEFSPDYNPDDMKLLLRLHTFASLYGWNLSGLVVICRFNDFPIRFHSKWLVALHWTTVILLAPLGYTNKLAAAFAVVGYSVILALFFFSKGKEKAISNY